MDIKNNIYGKFKQNNKRDRNMNDINERISLIEIILSEIIEGAYTDKIKERVEIWKEFTETYLNIIPSRDISFETKSKLSEILDRLVLSKQDRKDLEKYIYYGGGDNIDYIKENLNVFLKYKDKLLNIIEGVPEEFDSLIEIFDYIEQHIKEFNIKFKEINNNILKVDENNPFEKGEVENSAVLKGGDNKVISESGVALGKNNLVGLKGFYYKHIRFVTSKIANVYLSKTQVVPTITTGGEIKDKTIVPYDYYSIGDIISIVNDNKYDNIATIGNMSEGMIQIIWNTESPFTAIQQEAELSPEDYTIYCLDKPENGLADIGKYSFAAGSDNKATNAYTEVSGKGNVARSKFAKVWGKDNVGGYNSTTFGINNFNLADNSLVNGTNNVNEGNNSVVHGNKNINKGKRSFVAGNQNTNLSTNGTNVGENNIAGSKGYYYKLYRLDVNEFVIQLFPTQQRRFKDLLLDSTAVGWKVGDILSVVNDNKYDKCLEITRIKDWNIDEASEGILVSFVDFSSGHILDEPLFTNVKNITNPNHDDYSVINISQPDKGIIDFGIQAYVEGEGNKSLNKDSHAEGRDTEAYGQYAHTEGRGTEAGYAAHAEGAYTHAIKDGSHSEGNNTWAMGDASHAEGFRSVAVGSYSHAEGGTTHANGEASHSEGLKTYALTKGSHAEGIETSARGEASHAEGYNTKAIYNSSHAEGEGAVANGNASHAEGYNTRTNNFAEHGEGIFNLSHKSSDTFGNPGNTIHSVGIGTSEDDRKNAHEIMEDGRHFVYGIGGYDGTNPSEAKDVATYLPNLVEITYAELKRLRDNSNLIPGQQYRITDYITTTTQDSTKSAEHQFDIIVIADDEKTLNEIARAVLHDGDTYFQNSNLAAWQIWYCLDNDTSQFAWADATNGKGVIYRMIDEFGNDCPYDFKNITFSEKYTFSRKDTTNLTYSDYTILGYCRNNRIETYSESQKLILNNIIFNVPDVKGFQSIFNNSFGGNCRNIKIIEGCNNNSFGGNCRDIESRNFSLNNIGSNVIDCVFGENFRRNFVGTGCQGLRVPNNCVYCVFEDGCRIKISNEDSTINLARYRIASTVNETVELTRGRAYETYVAKNSTGVVRQFCLADIADAIEQITIKVE